MHGSLQLYFNALSRRSESTSQDKEATEGRTDPSPAQLDKAAPVIEGPDGEEAMPKTDRRRKDVAFDFLVLDGIGKGESDQFPYAVGQDKVFELALALDPNAKKPSLISQLGRWRNAKKWVEWSDTQKLKITQAGKERRKELLDLCKRDGRLEEVLKAYQEAWGIRPTF